MRLPPQDRERFIRTHAGGFSFNNVSPSTRNTLKSYGVDLDVVQKRVGDGDDLVFGEKEAKDFLKELFSRKNGRDERNLALENAPEIIDLLEREKNIQTRPYIERAYRAPADINAHGPAQPTTGINGTPKTTEIEPPTAVSIVWRPETSSPLADQIEEIGKQIDSRYDRLVVEFPGRAEGLEESRRAELRQIIDVALQYSQQAYVDGRYDEGLEISGAALHTLERLQRAATNPKMEAQIVETKRAVRFATIDAMLIQRSKEHRVDQNTSLIERSHPLDQDTRAREIRQQFAALEQSYISSSDPQGLLDAMRYKASALAGLHAQYFDRDAAYAAYESVIEEMIDFSVNTGTVDLPPPSEIRFNFSIRDNKSIQELLHRDPPDGVSIIGPAEVEGLLSRLQPLTPDHRFAVFQVMNDLQQFELDHDDNLMSGFLTVAYRQAETRFNEPLFGVESLLSAANVHLHNNKLESAAISYELALERAQQITGSGAADKQLEIMGLLAQTRLHQLHSTPTRKRGEVLAKITQIAESAEALSLSPGTDAQRGLQAAIRLAELTGAALASEGEKALTIAEHIRAQYGDLPNVEKAVDAFFQKYQQGSLTAAAETLLAELNSESLGEAVGYQGGGALVGAAIGTWVFPGVGTAAGALVGWLVGLGSLKTKNLVQGRHRIGQAWNSGIDAHTSQETMMNAAFTLLDVVDVGVPIKAGMKLGSKMVGRRLLGHWGLSESGQQVLEATGRRLARNLAEVGVTDVSERQLKVMAKRVLMDEWARAAREVGQPVVWANLGVQAAVFAPMADELVEAMKNGDQAKLEELATQAVRLATFVAVVGFGPQALTRFNSSKTGREAAIQTAMLRARPTPSTVRLLDGSEFRSRLNQLAEITEGVDAQRFADARTKAAFVDPTSGKIYINRDVADGLSDTQLRDLLGHEITHTRIHRLEPEVWNRVVSEVTSHPQYVSLKQSLLNRNPRMRNYNEAQIIDELISEGYRPRSSSSVLLSGPEVRAAGLTRPLPQVDLTSVRRGDPISLDSEGLYFGRSGEAAPLTATNRYIQQALDSGIIKSSERKSFTDLYAHIGREATGIQRRGNMVEVELDNGGKIRAMESPNRVDLVYIDPGEKLILWEVKGAEEWTKLGGNAAAKQLGETLMSMQGQTLPAHGYQWSLGGFLETTTLWDDVRAGGLTLVSGNVKSSDEAFLAVVLRDGEPSPQIVGYHPLERSDLNKAGLTNTPPFRLEDEYTRLLRDTDDFSIRNRVPVPRLTSNERVMLIPVKGSLGQ